MKCDKEFVNTLEDEIIKRGAPDMLISNRAQVEISKKAMDVLRMYAIDNWQSEPHTTNTRILLNGVTRPSRNTPTTS